jgi:hypothetical protein
VATIQVAADEDQGIAPLLVAPGPFLFGIEKHMHALKNKAPIRPAPMTSSWSTPTSPNSFSITRDALAVVLCKDTV